MEEGPGKVYAKPWTSPSIFRLKTGYFCLNLRKRSFVKFVAHEIIIILLYLPKAQ